MLVKGKGGGKKRIGTVGIANGDPRYYVSLRFRFSLTCDASRDASDWQSNCVFGYVSTAAT